ncbi:MAG: hypothetical protein Q9173_004192 [Seirophora scorigena]
MADIASKSPFSPYRADGKLYGFVCVVTGAAQPVGEAIVSELAGTATDSGISILPAPVTKELHEH